MIMTNQKTFTTDEIKKQLDDFNLKHVDFADYYARIEELNIGSLQEVACERDREYLKKISTILQIIMSIISHPHIANKREEIVTRIEQAKQLSNEDFSRVLKDGSLWKRYNIKLVPENVYYHQNVDELVIYENRFVCMVLDLIEKEISEYVGLYVKMLPSLKNGILPRLDGTRPRRILTYAELLKRKVVYLKNSYFYKEVSKAKKITGSVQRTNILLKDNLYGRVYRFYKEYLLSEEKFVSQKLLSDYFTALSLKELKIRGFKTVGTGDFNAKILENDSFTVEFSSDEKSLTFIVRNKISGISSSQSVILSLSPWFGDVEKPSSYYDSVTVLSCFGSARFDKKPGTYDEIFTEAVIVKNYFAEIVGTVETDKEVYSRYCPVCRDRLPSFSDGVFSCAHCGSRYTFVKKGDGDALWFIRLRRS